MVGLGKVVFDVVLAVDPVEADNPVAGLWCLRFSGSSWFLRHHDETKTLLKSQPQIWEIGADREQLATNQIVN